jgi:hypothetical protein
MPVVIVAAIAGVAASGALRAPVENLVQAKLGRTVEMRSLHIHLLSMTPSATVKGLKIANAAWAGTDPMVDVGRAKVALSLPDLLHGEVVIANLEMDTGEVDLHRTADGRANWSSGQVDDKQAALPVIERMELGTVALKYTDEGRKLAFNGALHSTDSAEGDPRRAFQLEGKGILNQRPMRVEVTGGSVLNADTSKPYPFTAVASHGATKITADGTFTRAFDLSSFQAKAHVSGPNMADLYYLTGVVFPLTKAYTLSGDLVREGSQYHFKNFVGRVGGSDLRGEMNVDTSGERLMFTADLHSRLLDPADAGVIFGSNEEKAKRLLPDVKLDVTRLRKMNADVEYKAAAINVSTLPLKEVALHLRLEDGQLVLNPLTLTLPQGTVSGTLAVDARQDVPGVELDVILSGARLENFVPKNALAGPLLARVKLKGRGDSVHAAAAAADGTAVVVIPGGEIRQAFAELMGVNVARGLGLLLSDSQQQTPVRCAIAHFEAKDGLMMARHVVFDTGVVKATGEGTVNLGDEALDLRLRGQPKRVRLLHVAAPVTIKGTLLEPKISADVAGASAQVGVATVLGVVLTPAAAILPFVDAGLTNKADCVGLLADAREDGVPLKK